MNLTNKPAVVIAAICWTCVVQADATLSGSEFASLVPGHVTGNANSVVFGIIPDSSFTELSVTNNDDSDSWGADSFALSQAPKSITIDINRGLDNCSSPRRDGHGVPLEISGSGNTDIADIDLGTLSLAIGITANTDNASCVPIDVNADGVYDLVCNNANRSQQNNDRGTARHLVSGSFAVEGADTICLSP